MRLSRLVCGSLSARSVTSTPNAPLPCSSDNCGRTTSQQASINAGSMPVGWPVADATSHPWINTSIRRWPAYTEPGTGPYETAQGASSAPGISKTVAAASAERS